MLVLNSKLLKSSKNCYFDILYGPRKYFLRPPEFRVIVGIETQTDKKSLITQRFTHEWEQKKKKKNQLSVFNISTIASNLLPLLVIGSFFWFVLLALTRKRLGRSLKCDCCGDRVLAEWQEGGKFPESHARGGFLQAAESLTGAPRERTGASWGDCGRRWARRRHPPGAHLPAMCAIRVRRSPHANLSMSCNGNGIARDNATRGNPLGSGTGRPIRPAQCGPPCSQLQPASQRDLTGNKNI